jgi:LEA14-like dessication related protein
MHKNKVLKISLIIFTIALIVLISLFLFWKSKAKNTLENKLLPVIDITKIDLVNLSEEKVDLLAHLKLKNNTPISISIDSIAYTISLKNEQVAQSIYPEPIDLNAHNFSIIKLPITLYYKKVEKLFSDLKSKHIDSTVMKIRMMLYSKLIPSGSVSIEIEQNIPVIKMPQIDVQNIHVEKITTRGAIVMLALQIKNPNTMNFSFRDLTYNVTFENHEGIKGAIAQSVEIPAKDSTIVTIPLNLNYKDVAVTLGNYIEKGKNLQYDITLKTILITNIHALKNSELILHSNGKIKNIENAMKK